MNIDWSKAAPPPEPGVPDLRRTQFEFVMATRSPQGRYLGDMVSEVIEVLKPVEPDYYRLLKSRLAGNVFSFLETMALVTEFIDILEAMYPDEDFSAAAILTIWNGALANG